MSAIPTILISRGQLQPFHSDVFKMFHFYSKMRKCWGGSAWETERRPSSLQSTNVLPRIIFKGMPDHQRDNFQNGPKNSHINSVFIKALNLQAHFKNKILCTHISFNSLTIKLRVREGPLSSHEDLSLLPTYHPLAGLPLDSSFYSNVARWRISPKTLT